MPHFMYGHAQLPATKILEGHKIASLQVHVRAINRIIY